MRGSTYERIRGLTHGLEHALVDGVLAAGRYALVRSRGVEHYTRCIRAWGCRSMHRCTHAGMRRYGIRNAPS